MKELYGWCQYIELKYTGRGALANWLSGFQKAEACGASSETVGIIFLKHIAWGLQLASGNQKRNEI